MVDATLFGNQRVRLTISGRCMINGAIRRSVYRARRTDEERFEILRRSRNTNSILRDDGRVDGKRYNPIHVTGSNGPNFRQYENCRDTAGREIVPTSHSYVRTVEVVRDWGRGYLRVE